MIPHHTSLLVGISSAPDYAIGVQPPIGPLHIRSRDGTTPQLLGAVATKVFKEPYNRGQG